MDANELDDGMASGMARGGAPLPANAKLFIAEVRPETMVPMRIPTTSVSATNNPATIFSRRAQLNILVIGSPISAAPVFSPPSDPSREWNPIALQYNTENLRKFSRANSAPENTLALWPGWLWRFADLISSPSLTPKPGKLLSLNVAL
jgi:hypothetical protein